MFSVYRDIFISKCHSILKTIVFFSLSFLKIRVFAVAPGQLITASDLPIIVEEIALYVRISKFFSRFMYVFSKCLIISLFSKYYHVGHLLEVVIRPDVQLARVVKEGENIGLDLVDVGA